MFAFRHITVIGIVLAAGSLSRASDDPLVPAVSLTAGPAQAGVAPAPAQQYWFGVAVQNLPPAIARQLKLRPDQGLMVLEVLPNSPAERAELRTEDVLVEVDGAPLTTYEELARAANQAGAARGPSEASLTAALIPGSCRLTILREGDRKSVTIIPAPRPEGFLVTGGPGANLSSFTFGAKAGAAARGKQPPGMRSIVLPNGATAQVGPGYSVDLTGSEASTLSIKRLVSGGATIMMSQEVDAAGSVKNRITVGGKTYLIERGKISSLPEDLRPLAEELLASAPTPASSPASSNAITFDQTPPGAVAIPAVDTPDTTRKRIEALEKQNAELRNQNDQTQQKLDRVLELLQKKGQ